MRVTKAPDNHDLRNQHEHRRTLMQVVKELHHRLEEVERQLRG